MSLQVEFTFDKKTYRHFMDGFEAVMHCHHYMSLLTQLAGDLDEYGGTRILRESVEDTIRPIIDNYVEKQGINDPAQILAVGADYYELMGMGLMKATGDETGGEVTLTRSHVDQGWIKKFGKNEQPINHWTCGFISAMWGAAFKKPVRTYEVTEASSLVRGDDMSRFSVQGK